MDREEESYHRVKVYKLDKEGNWVDKGTGLISVTFLEQSEQMGMVVISEQDGDGKMLLCHKLLPEGAYQVQDNTIISWTDKDLEAEMALSFEKKDGCEQVWAQIKQAQDAMKQGEFGYEDVPIPEMSNLEDLAKTVCMCPPPQRERLANAMLRPSWISTLLDVCKQCEDLEDSQSLGHIFRIVRGAIMLNDAGLLEELLKEEYVMDVVGALEQDPELATPQKHREFLSSSVLFKEVVPIKDAALLAKIHQTYRIQYIKDVILPRSLDDATYATLSSLALFNNVEVVSTLANDPEFLSQLFLALDKANPGGEAWADLVAFLQEFCNLARHLQQNVRQQLFSKLVQLGLFEQITRIMKIGSETTKLKATDILLAVMQHDTQALRNFLQQQKDNMLFSLLVREFTEGSGDGGLGEQVAELLKTLLDPDTLKDKPEKNEFVDLFYNKFMDRLVEVIQQDKQINPKEGTRHVPATTLSLVVDFVCFCIVSHSYRIKYYIVKKQMLSKVLHVIRRPERWLACAAVRIVRTCCSTKDPNNNRHPEQFFSSQLIKNNLFEPVMSAFFQNGDRYNLLNSTVLDLIEFVIKENCKDIIKHLVDMYSNRFEEVDYVDTFVRLVQKHEQNIDLEQRRAADERADIQGGPLRGRTFAFDSSGEPLGLRGRGARRRWDERGLSRDEEDYFDMDEDDSGPSSSGSADEIDRSGAATPPDGPLPRIRRPMTSPDSPPSSPKRGRSVPMAGGPVAKRRAGTSGPILTIATPSTLPPQSGSSGQHHGTPIPQGNSGSGISDSTQRGEQSPVLPWQGLVDYDDDDDDDDDEDLLTHKDTSKAANGPVHGTTTGSGTEIEQGRLPASVLLTHDDGRTVEG